MGVTLLALLVIAAMIVLRNRAYTVRNALKRQRVRRDRGRYIYAFTDYGQLIPVVKIGRASDVRARLAAHRTAAPFGMLVFMVCKVNDSHEAERYLHNRYAVWRLRRSGEWFFLTPGMLFDLVILNDNRLRRKIAR